MITRIVFCLLTLPFIGMATSSPAAAQGAIDRIAYDQCGPDLGTWDVGCSVFTLVNGSHTLVASGGVGPRWSPDGSRIAFTGSGIEYVTSPANLDEILVANLADGSIANLTNHPARDWGPAWSRDGRIAFVSDRDGAPELYVMAADGTNLTRLTNSVGFRGAFAWSFDGGRIAFASDRDGAPELYVMDADGSNTTRLTYGVGFIEIFVWSPYGGRIAFTCEDSYWDICAIDTDGANVVRLTAGGAAFSLVDGRLALTNGDGTAVIDIDGTVTRAGAATRQLVFSPDGSRLAFVGATSTWIGRCYFGGGAHNADDFCMAVPDIYVMNRDGTGLTQIASGGGIDWFTPPPGQPVASFTYGCSGSACAFDGSGSLDTDGNITSYTWQFGDGTSGSGATASHTYSPGNRYAVTLKVTDDTGVTGSLSMNVDANANAPPVASFTPTCNGLTCTFDGSGSSDPDGTVTSHSWSFGDGTTGSGATPGHTYAAAGSYIVTLTATDDDYVTGTQSQTVSVQALAPVDPAVQQIAMISLYECEGAHSPEDPPCQKSVLMDNDGSHVIPIEIGENQAWSPDGTRLLVNGDDIFVRSVLGGASTNLTNHPARYWGATWSPDGARIAFASDRDGPADLYVMNADGSGVVRIGTGVGLASQPTWSPDSERLAFTCIVDPVPPPWWSATGNFDICSINTDGSGFARLTSGPGSESHPDWSPDGSRILFTDGELVVMNPDGSNLTHISPGTPADSPSWSADGTRIAFVYHLLPWDPDAPWMPFSFVFVINADGSGGTDLGWGYGPTWRPFPGGLNERPVASFTYECSGPTCTLDGARSSDIDGTIASYRWQFGDGTTASGATVTHTFSWGHDVRLIVMDDDGALATSARNINQPPVVAFTATCSGLTCNFDGSASFDPDGYISSFSWNFGDYTYASGSTKTHTYAAAGTYIVTLTATDQDYGTGTQSHTVSGVYVNAPPIASYTSACSGLTCSFNAASSSDPDGTIASYAWNFGDGTTGSGATASRTYAAGGTYTVTLIVTDNAAATGQTASIVDVNAPPIASYTSACSGLTCSFNAASSSDPDGTIASYAWSFGDGTTGSGATASRTYAAGGTYTVTLIVTDNAGAASQTAHVVTVNAPPVASFTSACSGLTCSFNASGSSDPDGTIASYAWTFGDATTGSGATASRTYAAGGTYSVLLTVTDNGAATSTQAQSVTVVPPDMHVGDLDGASTIQQNTWTATVTITVHTSSHGPIANAAVSGAWNDGSTGSCTTNPSGQCAVSKAGIPKKTGSVNFTVTNVAGAPLVYKAAANHDADGDSNGTTVTVTKQ